MAKGDIHTSHDGEKWVNKVEGGQQASNSAPRKEDAQKQGADMARDRKVEHYIHNMDGKIGERNTYRHDPRSSKG